MVRVAIDPKYIQFFMSSVMRNLYDEIKPRLAALYNLKNIPSKEYHQRFVEKYKELASMSENSVLEQYASSIEGLYSDEVEQLKKKWGPNEVISEVKSGWLRELLNAMWNPFNLLLASIAVISYLTGDLPGTTVVGVMIFLSVVLTFTQEARSNRAAEKLKAMVSMTSTVIRRNREEDGEDNKEDKVLANFREVPIHEIVPGDIIKLSAGDMIPADVRIIKSKDLFMGQSALTGEAMPVEKHAYIGNIDSVKSILDIQNICFMGTSVLSGTATGVVINTGTNSYFGRIARTISKRRTLTDFDRGIRKFSWLMLSFMCVMAPLVLLINGFSKGDWAAAFMFALSVAVGLTPEMLPMIVTVNLAAGARRMAKKHVIVKRLTSIQNFGAMDVLCTDKTGTLTQDKVILLKYMDPTGAEENETIMHYAYLNSYYQTGLKNLLDHAVLNHVKEDLSRKPKARYRKVDEIPFDFQRRRMSVIVEENGEKDILICKGALDEILHICKVVEFNGERVPLNEDLRESMQTFVKDLSEDGLRVLALAYKEMEKNRNDYSVKDEDNLVLLGLLAFLDPPKESAAKAIKGLNHYGVSVKVLTGDNESVTRKICKEVGLHVDRIVLGHEIEKMDDVQLANITEEISVFAKLNPMQKQRIIRSIHAKGHVVGFLGDGINDAPALKEADVGISVDNAVDIAKESADIILLEKNLLVLEDGVLEGRWVFGNITKYLRMGASSNFGNVFSVLGASYLLPFLPILPIQLLIQNLLYDVSQSAIPFDHVDAEYLERPRKWEISNISRYMLFLGPVSSLFDYITFAVLWFVYQANTISHQSLFQTGWFVESLISQTLIVHFLRTKKIPFLESSASPALLMTTLLVILCGAYLPFSFLSERLGFTPLPFSFFAFLFPLVFVYMLLTQWVKTHLLRNVEAKLKS